MPYDLYPAVDENYDFAPEIRQALARSLELRNDVEPMTTVLRNNLMASEKWDGRVIANTDTDHLERWNEGTGLWVEIPNSTDVVSPDQGDLKYEQVSRKGFASGYASLDVSAKVPYTQIPTGSVANTVSPGTHNHDTVYAPIAAGVPAGAIMLWASATAPSGWRICDGSALLRSAFLDLFNAIGTTYGIGDGITTFAVPNLKGRVVVGYDSAQTEFNTMSEIGGAKTHTLSVSEMPSHAHNGRSGNWKDNSGAVNDAGWNNRFTVASGSIDSTSGILITGNAGSGSAHNNLQPYMTLNYIIKT